MTVTYQSTFTPSTSAGASHGAHSLLGRIHNVYTSVTPVGYWEVNTTWISTGGTVTNTNGLVTDTAFPTKQWILLTPVQQTWGVGETPSDYGLDDPNTQQILLESDNTAYLNDAISGLWATYAPRGGIDSSNYAFSFTAGLSGSPTILTSGRQLLVAGNQYNPSYFNGDFYIVEHRDPSIVKHPASSFSLMPVGGTLAANTFSYCYHIGKIFAPVEWNDPGDPTINPSGGNATSPGASTITGDAIMWGHWDLATSSTTAGVFEQRTLCRFGDSFLNINSYYLLSTDARLASANGFARFVPYKVVLAGLNSSGLVGYTKYIRQVNTTFALSPILITTDPGRTWAGWNEFNQSTPDVNNSCMLWGDTTNVIS